MARTAAKLRAGSISPALIALAISVSSAAWSAPTGNSAAGGSEETLVRTHGRHHASWYVGFSVGAGLGVIDDERGFDLKPSAGPTVALRGGWIVQHWLLVGLETSWWSAPRMAWRQVHHTDAVLTFFPLPDLGLYGRIGLGAGVAVLHADEHSEQRTDVGFDLKLAGGYELALTRRFGLGVDVTYARTHYTGGTVHDVCGAVGLTWY